MRRPGKPASKIVQAGPLVTDKMVERGLTIYSDDGPWEDGMSFEAMCQKQMRAALDAIADEVVEICAKAVEERFLEHLNRYVCYADEVAEYIRSLKTGGIPAEPIVTGTEKEGAT